MGIAIAARKDSSCINILEVNPHIRCNFFWRKITVTVLVQRDCHHCNRDMEDLAVKLDLNGLQIIFYL
jgi:hypothetical protein